MVSIEENPKDWMAAAWMAPFTFGMTLLECMSSVSEAWLQIIFAPESHHAHETHGDLEVPDPIEGTGEHDLFA